MLCTDPEKPVAIGIPAPIKVYLTDDDPQFSTVAIDLLSQQAGTKLIGTAESVEQTFVDLSLAEVDVLVLDVYMKEGESLEAIEDIKHQRPGIKILVITGGGWEDQQVASILAGADGFLYKPFTSSDLTRAIEVLHKGKVFFDATALTKALNPSHQAHQTEPQTLTQEERDFLELIRQGRSNSEIATLLNTGIKAVYQRRFRLKSKLGLRGARDLASFAAAQKPAGATH